MSDSVPPHRQQPTRLPCPWDSPGKNTGVDCHFLLQCMKVKSESEAAQSCPALSDPMDWLQPTRVLHPWEFPGKNTGVGCCCLLQLNTYLYLKCERCKGNWKDYLAACSMVWWIFNTWIPTKIPLEGANSPKSFLVTKYSGWFDAFLKCSSKLAKLERAKKNTEVSRTT